MDLQDIGNGGFWPTGDDSDDLSEREKVLQALDLLTQKTLATLQKIIGSYVNIGSDAELSALQDCLSDLLRGASQCRAEGKKYQAIACLV